MSARIALHAGMPVTRPATIVCLDAFRPQARLAPEERRLLARLRALERTLLAKTGESRALRGLVLAEDRP
jgi:hypothetical protein